MSEECLMDAPVDAVTSETIAQCERRIRPLIRRTPVVEVYGADLGIEGDRYADALAASEIWAQQTGALPVPAFDQKETITGQGTIGLELSEQAPDIDTLLVAVGGGGLIAGIAAWYAGRIKVVGVEPHASPTLTRALEAGYPIDA